MQQLTVRQYVTLIQVKNKQLITDFAAIPSLLDKKLIKEIDGQFTTIPGQRYNYRGNSYTL